MPHIKLNKYSTYTFVCSLYIIKWEYIVQRHIHIHPHVIFNTTDVLIKWNYRIVYDHIQTKFNVYKVYYRANFFFIYKKW